MAFKTEQDIRAYGDVMDEHTVPACVLCLHCVCNSLFTLAAAVLAHAGLVTLRPNSGPARGKNTGPWSQQGGSHRHEPYNNALSSRAKAGGAACKPVNNGGDWDDNGSIATGKSKRRGAAPDGLLLACPCYKYNPILYLDCLLRNRLKDTSIVVQHLLRGHDRQPIHCPVCGQTFGVRIDCDRHIRSQTCQPRNFHYEGLTQDQLNALGQSRRTQTESQRWYSIWDILYPDAPRPDSPYVGAPLEEIVAMVRRAVLWDSRNSLSEYLVDASQAAQLVTVRADQLTWSYLQSIIPQQDNLGFLASDGAPASTGQQPPQPYQRLLTVPSPLTSGDDPIFWDSQWSHGDFGSYPNNPSEGFVSITDPSFSNLEPTATLTTNPTSLRPDEDPASAEANKPDGRLPDGAVGGSNPSLHPSAQ